MQLSKTIAHARVARLVNLGLADTSCTPTERIRELRARIGDDELAYRELETLFSALGDVTRLKMLKLIANEELCACEVMATLELTQPTTSHHLGILERAGLLVSRRSGKWVFYKIANTKASHLVNLGFGMVGERGA